MRAKKLCLSFVLFATPSLQAEVRLPHLDPEMTSREYEQALEELFKHVKMHDDPELEAILKFGKRNISWLEKVNAQRKPEQQLPLSTPETQRAYPIDAPSISNAKLIKQRLADLKTKMPDVMQDVLFEKESELPNTTEMVSDEEFLQNVRDMDRIYQSTSRWLLQVPFLEEYKRAAKGDVRGFYHLTQELELETKLTKWSMQTAELQERLRTHLLNICFNNDKQAAVCATELKTAESDADGVWNFYKRYVDKAKKLWLSYFAIPKTRPEARWNTIQPDVFIFPFKNPNNAPVAKWFEENVEDEWKWFGWYLDIRYTAEEGPFARIKFQEGATPNVNGIAGDTITMDANRSIQEYTSRWTIRHEFGHVLGYPDCYVEFFDVALDAMVNYQLDITNLMCSRKGKLKQIHFDELKRAYFKTDPVQ